MSTNVMNEYMKITQEEIIAYMKLIFERKYNKKITMRYIDAYMNVRFYNFYPKDESLTFRKNYFNAIKEEEIRISNSMPEKKKLIENMGLFFYYILYFDKLSYKVDIDEIINKLFLIRKKLLKKDNEDFKNNFLKTYNEFYSKKEEFLEKFATEDFSLKITNYEGFNNANRVLLSHDIKFNMIYSKEAIEEVFNTGLIAQNKLFVEYNLITVEVINDILKGNFKKQYIIEFDVDLLKKSKKLKRLLEIINNSAIQDKLNIKIEYKDFIKNKEQIYELMREGYRFAIVLDNTFEPEYSNFQRLNAFNYIIASKKLKDYDLILANEEMLKGLIKI